MKKTSLQGILKLKYKGEKGYLRYFGRKNISVAFSQDLKKWKTLKKAVLEPRPGYFDNLELHPLNPLLIKEGILLVYFVKNPLSLGAALFSKNNPIELLWRSANPLFETKEKIWPLRTEVKKEELIVYFKPKKKGEFQKVAFSLKQIFGQERALPKLERLSINPLLAPIVEHAWESRYVLNPAAIYLEAKVHLVYRAIGDEGISVLGYAKSRDGVKIEERLAEPIFVPPSPFERREKSYHLSYSPNSGWGFGGCEDPRLSRVGAEDTIYMVYTAFTGSDCPRIALTSIKVDDFLAKRWSWKRPVLISPPGEVHKNWVIFPEKINPVRGSKACEKKYANQTSNGVKGKYAILHSLCPKILIEYVNSLEFDGSTFIASCYDSKMLDSTSWDNWVRGAGPPPIKTKEGWLVLYHAMDKNDPGRYKLGAMILELNSPEKILYRSAEPILEPDQQYENEGFKAGVVYACGAVVINNELFVYYGGADTVVCGARKNLDELLEAIKQSKPIKLEIIKTKQ